MSDKKLYNTLTGSGIYTDTDTDTKTVPNNNDAGDHDRFSHYVDRNDLMEAMVNGTAIIALCGKIWVSTRDGDKFPVCPDCKEIYESIPN